MDGQFVTVEAVERPVVTDPQPTPGPVPHLSRVLRRRVGHQSRDARTRYSRSGPRARATTRGHQAMPPSRSDQGRDDPITGRPTRLTPGIDATPLRAVPPNHPRSSPGRTVASQYFHACSAYDSSRDSNPDAQPRLLAHFAALQLLHATESLLLIGGTPASSSSCIRASSEQSRGHVRSVQRCREWPGGGRSRRG